MQSPGSVRAGEGVRVKIRKGEGMIGTRSEWCDTRTQLTVVGSEGSHETWNGGDL